jgi:2-methylcitrate dehydratase PrpD
VIGYEVECRFGTILNPSHYENGWHATCTQGSLAAVAAAGYLLNLTPIQLAHAFGINASQASGTRRNFGTMTMSMHSGIAASNGIKAALLAKQGFTGDPEIFDGKMSFGDVFAKEWSNDLLRDNLPLWGEPFFINQPGPTFKLYPCGRPPLFAVDAVLLLKEKFGITASDVKKIVAQVSFLYPKTLIHTRPVNGLQAKASLEYCIATSLIDQRPVLNSFNDDAVTRPIIKELLERVEVVVPPHLQEDIPAVRKAPFDQPVTIEMYLNDGRVVQETVPFHKGSPKNPASSAELQDKFRDCLGLYCSASQIQTVLDAMQNPHLPVSEWMQLMKIKK